MLTVAVYILEHDQFRTFSVHELAHFIVCSSSVHKL